MTCSFCGSIPDIAVANTGRDHYFEPPITLLERHRIATYDDLRECRECGAVFHWHDDTSQTGSGNNDEEVLTRIPSQVAPFVRAFLHRGERRAEDVAQDAERLLELPDRVRDLLLSSVRHRDRDLAAHLVPWMLDQIRRRELLWANEFVQGVASDGDAARVVSELATRAPSPAFDKLRAHCRQAQCTICRKVGGYPGMTARRDLPLPAPLGALVQLGASDEVDIWECPECDSLFEWQSKDGNEGRVVRTSEGLASAYRACIHRNGNVPASDVEMVFSCSCAKVVLSHGMRRDRELVRQLVPRSVYALSRYEQAWLRDLLSAFVEGDPSDAMAVLDAIAKTEHSNADILAVAARCRRVASQAKDT